MACAGNFAEFAEAVQLVFEVQAVVPNNLLHVAYVHFGPRPLLSLCTCKLLVAAELKAV